MRNALIKNLAKLAAKKIMVWLVSKAGFFAWGPVNAVLLYVVTKVLEKALELTFFGALITYIFIDVSRDRNAVEKIIAEIKEKEKELNEDDIAEFDERLAKAGRDLIRFGTIG